jgi:hypothetical protein
MQKVTAFMTEFNRFYLRVFSNDRKIYTMNNRLFKQTIKLSTTLGLRVMLAAVLVFWGSGVQAQGKQKVALLVGINTYVRGITPLYGTGNDCDDVAKVLQSRNFKVIRLQDADATYAKIESKMQELSAQLRPTDEFVYYHSGHGSRNGVLLTADSPTSLDKNVIAKKTLSSWMDKLKSGKTVILDACFSGALGAKSLTARGEELQVKFYAGPGEATKDLDVVVTADNESKSQSNFPVFTSSSPVEFSFEVVRDGRKCGIFTHHLIERLKNLSIDNSDKTVKWSDVVGPVVKTVSERVPQTPSFTHKYSNSFVFDNTTTALSNGVDVTSLREYVDIENPSPMHVTSSISSTQMRRGQSAVLETTVNKDGYVLFLNYDSEDRGQVTDLRGKPVGKVVRSSAGSKYSTKIDITANTSWEKFKVFWFDDQVSAEAFASKFRTNDKNSSSGGQANVSSKLVTITGLAPFDLSRVFTTSHMVTVVSGGEKN